MESRLQKLFNELEVFVRYLLTAVAWILFFEIADKWNNVQNLKMSLIKNGTPEVCFKELTLQIK